MTGRCSRCSERRPSQTSAHMTQRLRLMYAFCSKECGLVLSKAVAAPGFVCVGVWVCVEWGGGGGAGGVLVR